MVSLVDVVFEWLYSLNVDESFIIYFMFWYFFGVHQFF